MKRTILLSLIIGFVSSFNSIAQVSIIAGNGVAGFAGDSSAATGAEIYGPAGIAIDGQGNKYFADQANNRVRKILPTGIILTIAGTGTAGYSGDSSLATSAKLNGPVGVAVDTAGNVYIVDKGNNRIRKVDNTGMITTIAGTGVAGFYGDNGPATAAKLSSPSGIAVDNKGNIYIADRTNIRVRKINSAGIITTFAGSGYYGYNGDNYPSASLAGLSFVSAVAVDKIGNVYIADKSDNRIRKVDTFNKIHTIAGDNSSGFHTDGLAATNTSFYGPNGLAVDSLGNVYVSDELNYRIRRIDFNDQTVETIVGTGVSGYNGDSASGKVTQLGDCKGIAVDNAGNLYFSDWSNNRVMHVTSTVAVKQVHTDISDVSIYPNPGDGVFTFNVSSNSNEQAHLIITSVTGAKIREMDTKTNVPVSVNLDAPTGLYIISVTTANAKWSGKLEIVKR